MKARSVLAALVLATAVLPATAQTADQWIARARARLGTEAALQAVNSVHFIGTIDIDGTNSRAADFVFQKPMQQRITFTNGEVIEVLALDDYDAWQKKSSVKNPSQWQITLLDAAQARRLRAQVWDNLNFLRGIEKLRGSVRVDGDVQVDGLDCVKLVFTYYDSIVLARYFEKATARLVKTETELGVEIREEGEMFVDGVRFARKIINKEKSGRVVTMTFDKILLNEQHPASEFAVPTLPVN